MHTVKSPESRSSCPLPLQSFSTMLKAIGVEPNIRRVPMRLVISRNTGSCSLLAMHPVTQNGQTKVCNEVTGKTFKNKWIVLATFSQISESAGCQPEITRVRLKGRRRSERQPGCGSIEECLRENRQTTDQPSYPELRRYLALTCCRRAACSSLSLGYSRALTQQLSVYYHARARSFIDFPSSLDIILVHFIPIILGD